MEPVWQIRQDRGEGTWTWIVYYDGTPRVWVHSGNKWALPESREGAWGCTITEWGAMNQVRKHIARFLANPKPKTHTGKGMP